ncbi:MAG: ABC transporter substrate-binding protein [Thermoplasmata archaeon]
MTDSGRLRIGYLSTFYHTSHLLRADRWAAEGIEPEWTLEMTGPALVRSLAAGDLDVAYIGLTPATIAIARGVPLRCVAGGHEEGTVVIGDGRFRALRPDETDLDALLHEFEGVPVGIPAAGSIHDVIFRELLREHGLEGRVPIRNFPQADLITEALVDGSVGAGVGTPALAVAGRRYAEAHIVVPAAVLWPHNPSYGIVATDTARARPELLRAFLRAHEAATHLIRTAPREAARRTAEAVEVTDADYVEETYRVSPRYCAALPEEYVDATVRFLPVLERLGYLPRTVTAEEIFDRSLLAVTHPEPAHYGDGIAR